MNDIAELKRYVAAHAESLGIPGDHYQPLLNRIVDDGSGPGSWVGEWAGCGDTFAAQGQWLEASQHYNFARFPFVDGPARQAALDRCVRAVDQWRQRIPGIERLDLDILGGRIGCWAGWLDEQPPRPLLLITGGIVSIKEQWAPVLLAARELGLSAVVTEMPGVGENPHRYTPESWEMIPAILDAVADRADVTKSYLMAMSYSGQAALRAALEDARIRGIITAGAPILEAFTDAAWVRALPRVTLSTLAHLTGAPVDALPGLLPGWALSGSQLAALSVPVHYVASSRDEIIPPGDLRTLRRHVRDLHVLEHDDVHGAPAHAALTRQWMIGELGRLANGLALGDHVRAEQVELDFPDDVGDARLTGFAGREVTGFLGLAGAGPVRAVADESAGAEDLEQERGERQVQVLRGKKPRRCLSRRPGRAGS